MRAIIGPGDLPLIVRAERRTVSLTVATIELTCDVLVQHLESCEGHLACTAPEDRAPFVAEQIALIDALAELRGAR